MSASQHQQSSSHLATTSSYSTYDNDIGDNNTALLTTAADSVHTESETMPRSTNCHPVPDIAETAIVVGNIHQFTDNVGEEYVGNDIFLYSGRRLKRQDITDCLLKGP